MTRSISWLSDFNCCLNLRHHRSSLGSIFHILDDTEQPGEICQYTRHSKSLLWKFTSIMRNAKIRLWHAPFRQSTWHSPTNRLCEGESASDCGGSLEADGALTTNPDMFAIEVNDDLARPSESRTLCSNVMVRRLPSSNQPLRHRCIQTARHRIFRHMDPPAQRLAAQRDVASLLHRVR